MKVSAFFHEKNSIFQQSVLRIGTLSYFHEKMLTKTLQEGSKNKCAHTVAIDLTKQKVYFSVALIKCRNGK